MPLVLLIVATVGLLLVHKPPLTLLPSGVVVPAQALVVPVIVSGVVKTETTVVARQPVLSV